MARHEHYKTQLCLQSSQGTRHIHCCCTAGNPTVPPPPRLSAITVVMMVWYCSLVWYNGHDGMVHSMHALGTSLQQGCHYWATPLAAHQWLHSTIAGTSQNAHTHLIGLLHVCASASLLAAVPRLSLRCTSIEVFLHNAPCFSTRHTRSMPLPTAPHSATTAPAAARVQHQQQPCRHNITLLARLQATRNLFVNSSTNRCCWPAGGPAKPSLSTEACPQPPVPIIQ